MQDLRVVISTFRLLAKDTVKEPKSYPTTGTSSRPSLIAAGYSRDLAAIRYRSRMGHLRERLMDRGRGVSDACRSIGTSVEGDATLKDA